MFYPHKMAFLENAVNRKLFLRHLARKIPHHSKEYEMLVKAHDLTENLFDGEFRKSNDPYVTHPRAVMLISLELTGTRDTNILAACLMHDNREFAEEQGLDVWGSDFVENEFNYPIEMLIAAGTAPHVNRNRTSIDSHQIYHERLKLLATWSDFFNMKQSDRLHNLWTLSSKVMPRAQVVAKIIESERYYLPIVLQNKILVPHFRRTLKWLKKEYAIPIIRS